MRKIRKSLFVCFPEKIVHIIIMTSYHNDMIIPHRLHFSVFVQFIIGSEQVWQMTPLLLLPSSSSSSYSRPPLSQTELCVSTGSISPRSIPDSERAGAAVRTNISRDGGGPLYPHPPPSAAESLNGQFPFSLVWGLFSPLWFLVSLVMPPDWSRSGTHPHPTGAPLIHNQRLCESCLRSEMNEN